MTPTEMTARHFAHLADTARMIERANRRLVASINGLNAEYSAYYDEGDGHIVVQPEIGPEACARALKWAWFFDASNLIGNDLESKIEGEQFALPFHVSGLTDVELNNLATLVVQKMRHQIIKRAHRLAILNTKFADSLENLIFNAERTVKEWDDLNGFTIDQIEKEDI